jgi:hypothetical protein
MGYDLGTTHLHLAAKVDYLLRTHLPEIRTRFEIIYNIWFETANRFLARGT